MVFNRSLFRSASGEWETPQELFDDLSKEFGGFDLDPCASVENAKCPEFFTLDNSGLDRPWFGNVFLNPPYGRVITKWIEYAYSEATHNLSVGVIVALLPARTDTAWWHDYVMKADEIRFIRGRLKFGGAKNSAPFPSCVVVWT